MDASGAWRKGNGSNYRRKASKVSFVCRRHPIARRREDKQGPREAIRTQKWFRSEKKTTLNDQQRSPVLCGCQGREMRTTGKLDTTWNCYTATRRANNRKADGEERVVSRRAVGQRVVEDMIEDNSSAPAVARSFYRRLWLCLTEEDSFCPLSWERE